MKIPLILAILGSAPVFAQVVPATPTDFNTRPLGGGVNVGAAVTGNKKKGIARYIAHIILYDTRLWTSAEGKPLEAKLIAFEDLVAEAPQGAPQPELPKAPALPTIIRDGKARLLVKGKPVEIPLDRLSRQDRELIDGIKAALDKKASEGR